MKLYIFELEIPLRILFFHVSVQTGEETVSLVRVQENCVRLQLVYLSGKRGQNESITRENTTLHSTKRFDERKDIQDR